MSPSKNHNLVIVDASEHNLKHIDVVIPHHAMTVITGVSGSGKSSLAYQVIYKESQRRFLESFSAYSRQYLGKLEKPKVKEISGLQAALAINQQTAFANPRSTVGTMSGIYDYLRLLYARAGKAHCTGCGFEINHSQSGNCDNCGKPHPKLLSKLFSFNSTYGACPKCKGLGVSEQIDPNKLIADAGKSLAEGALVPTTPTGYIVYSQVRVEELDKVCQAHGFSVHIPWEALSEAQQNVVMYGSDRIKILFGKHALESRLKWKGITAKPREEAFYKGMIPIMNEILKRDRNDNILRFASSFRCPECEGKRLNKEALSVFIRGKHIAELGEMPLSELHKHLQMLAADSSDHELNEHILKHGIKRLEYLKLLGLDYLNLSRESTSLSGGEAQRIRLASQVGSGLQGILYILDEPSIGLHPRDNKKLLKVLKSLRDNGNTLLVVEHDEETIRAADYLIDMGPSAGIHGGDVLYQGSSLGLLDQQNVDSPSLTAAYYSNNTPVIPKRERKLSQATLRIKGASLHNLKRLNVSFRLNAFNVVCGVSGAGKSTLVHGILSKYLKSKEFDAFCEGIDSDIPISRIIEIDQSPIGRTPRSNPATYTDLFDHIRDIFGKLGESKARGYKKGRFSFNNTGGRCESCQGAGRIQLGMHFLGDVEVACTECHGKRFNSETLEVSYRGKNIFDILALSIEEARRFFEGESKVCRILDQLIKLDVGYLKLGQPSTTLSGGEAQRIKLASELYKTSKGHNLYILDEPTVGLHKADISYLMDSLNSIVDNNNTVIVIEHDLDVILQADHIIDLGPEGGAQGGYLVAQGNLEKIKSCDQSHTGKALRDVSEVKEITRQSDGGKHGASMIQFKGVATNNLKHIDVNIPLNKTTVITGVSGSGKSSLAFDTIYSESRNRFTESFSSYARRMMSKVKKAEMEHCSGLTPAIAIRQQSFRANPRSTVGTATEIYDFYRLLYSRAGRTASGSYSQLSASQFSFNNIDAACTHCKGMGVITSSTPEQLISDPRESLLDGAMDGSLPGKFFGDPHGQFVNTLIQVGKEENLDFGIAFAQLSKTASNIALYGTGKKLYDVSWHFKRGNRSGTHKMQTVWKGFVNLINEDYEIKRKGKRGEAFQFIISELPCPKCKGKRFREATLKVKFDGLDITQLASKSIQSACSYFEDALERLDGDTLSRSQHIIRQITSKLKTLEGLGLGFLSIDRPTASLSGGEAQRLRIASQLVSDLCGLTYVLDEPSTGLHPHDTQRLMDSIQQLRDNGNTVVLVEHDPDIIVQADHIIDLGPGAGNLGGEIIAEGSLEDILKHNNSVTAKYLQHKTRVKPIGSNLGAKPIQIRGAHDNNLKQIDLEIPTGAMVAITGLSGSGKTSLAFGVLAKSFKAGHEIQCQKISFGELDTVVEIDQQKIGLSPLSTAATYTGAFDLIRDVYAGQDSAKSLGFKKSHFSFNSKEGACPVCKGMGHVKVSMDFLSDVWINCDSCHGKRYKEAILKVTYQGRTISDVLQMAVEDAMTCFMEQPKIKHYLQSLTDIGLGYLKLGQATSSLSGGETQRLKLASHLIKAAKGKTLFIFDEPTTGLHMYDVAVLIEVFRKLVMKGHSIVVSEHNLDLIAASDWVIDLGPEGGDKGGSLLYSGRTTGLRHCQESYTAKALITQPDIYTAR